uniref:Nudix hydrolase domain-containing protein n=1 Tax=viral metagenome TaxID=1070528 RepID=A0A6C0JXB8_9ZZZZ
MGPKIVTEAQKVLDVFQPGLIRSAARLSHDPSKLYFYVEHPTDKWRVYLRTVCFIHELTKPFNPTRFLVVKRTDGDTAAASWEPPKGQMEGKDGVGNSIYSVLRDNIRREVQEEAKITNIRDLQHTGLVLQSRESNYPENTFFQYHIFTGYAHPRQIKDAFDKFKWFSEHPAAFSRLRRENREKDGISWFDSVETKIMGKWSPTMVKMYLDSVTATAK